MNPINMIETATPDKREEIRIQYIIASLHKLLEDGVEEQKETFSYLQKSIDQDSISDRKRFKTL